MGFFDRLLGREEQPAQQRPAPRPARTDDEIAVERYQYLLRTAPPETIEQVHTEAFAKLSSKQRDILFEQLTKNAPTPSERPANAEPATLAQAATRAEVQQPGSMARAFGGGGMGGPSFGSMLGASILGSVAGYVVGSALVGAFLPNDGAGDAGTDSAGSDSGGADSNGTDSAGDSSSADAGTTEAAGYDGGWDQGGDFGGGDFGGGDFF